MNLREYVIGKLLSGRFILTILTGIAFVICVWQKELPVGIAAIITMVFTLYFTRVRENGGKK